MPLSYEQVIRKGISRLQWQLSMEEKAQKRLPARSKDKPRTGTLFAIRNKRIAIREGALRKVQLIIKYSKISTGETKKYVVNPYSYRYRMTRQGRRKMLMAFDVENKHIKGFVLNNIKNVVITDRKFVPRWKIEI